MATQTSSNIDRRRNSAAWNFALLAVIVFALAYRFSTPVNSLFQTFGLYVTWQLSDLDREVSVYDLRLDEFPMLNGQTVRFEGNNIYTLDMGGRIYVLIAPWTQNLKVDFGCPKEAQPYVVGREYIFLFSDPLNQVMNLQYSCPKRSY